MSLQIYNTLSRQKEEFKPINPPKVGMYVCGVTVYDLCHLGHARALINFDVIYRYLKFSGYEVTFVRNFTDVDDKIINRATEKGVPWNEISEKFIGAFNEDMLALKNIAPTVEPKATENIAEMQNVIQGLIDKGYAYPAGKDIFYSVRKKDDYGKLSGKKIDDLESGVRVEVHPDKKDPLDFCLWKSSKPGEPTWESPWGPGRPGWHIECSAMSMKYLGKTFDIHGGGRDLSFPHHENEIAQSEAFSGKCFANYWVHNGFVTIQAEKMSKSLGNFLTIRDLLKEYDAEILRAFVLSAHYRSPIDYAPEYIQNVKQAMERWYTTLKRVHDEKGVKEGDVSALKKLVDSLKANFIESMDDDFNTARTYGLMFEIGKEWNRVLDDKIKVDPALITSFFKTVEDIHGVLGIFGSDPHGFLHLSREMGMSLKGVNAEDIELKIKNRAEAKKAKNYAEADAIRKELLDQGIQIKDNPDGTTSWSL